MDRKLWEERKEELRKRLFEDLEIGYLDRDIMDVLLKFFEREDSFTISSCSGRVTIVDAPMPWVREPSSVVFKKHSPITVDEIKHYMRQKAVWRLWAVVTGPIIHVSTATLDEALEVLRLGREAGMKHSGILSVSRKGIVVELKTGVKVTVLLKDGDEVTVREDTIPKLVSVINEALREGKERLNRLRKVLGIPPINYEDLWLSQGANK